MRKTFIAATKSGAKTEGKSLGWISLTAASVLALGFSALPLNITNGHLNLNQAKAAQKGAGGGGQGGGGSGSGGGSSGGGPEGNIGNAVSPAETRGGPTTPSESRGGSMGPSESRGGDKDRDTPAPTTSRQDSGSNSGRGNDVVTGSGKGFQAGPAQGRGFNELTVPLFPAAPAPAKGKGSTPNIQQRVGDQSGPDLDSNAEAALIERGWK